jgi:hypothetical protein
MSVMPAMEPNTTVSERAVPERAALRRHFLMCRPEHFAVTYAINPWMDPARGADAGKAVAQWEALRSAYVALGHEVSLIDPVEGLPDMVFAANGALVVGGRVYGARFTHPERHAEAPAYAAWLRDNGFRDVLEPRHTNEGEGDFLTLDDVILAGTGFRTEIAAHQEAQEFLGRPVVTLRLVDPRFYHLDTALFPLGGDNVAYFPGAAGPGRGHRGRAGRGGPRAQRRVRRPERGRQRGGGGADRHAAGPRFRAHPGGFVRIAQSRRRPEVLHARTPRLTCRDMGLSH